MSGNFKQTFVINFKDFIVSFSFTLFTPIVRETERERKRGRDWNRSVAHSPINYHG